MNKIVQIALLVSKIVLTYSANVSNEKSSLVFVFDTTGSMFDDLKQLREGAEMILNTALEESNIIADFVFVPFHDPGVGPATVTNNKTIFKAALSTVRVHGGGDCPEQSLTGLQLALTVSRPRSFVYVFTDATAHDHALVGGVLDAVQRKQTQCIPSARRRRLPREEPVGPAASADRQQAALVRVCVHRRDCARPRAGGARAGRGAEEADSVHGGGDCPEKSLTGLQLALTVSRPRSFVYVFTDATAHDHKLVGRVLDAVQRKQTQVVFVLTGHCNDLTRPSYLVYPQIAAASSGQVFYLNKTNVHKVLDFVRSSIKARSVNLGTVTNPAGYNYTREIPVDSSLDEVTVSVSGSKPQIQVFSPTGEQLTGPPRLVTTLDLAEIMVVKVLQPEPGNWSINVGSEAQHSVKVVGLSNLTFQHGFSVQRPNSPAETSYRPLLGAYNYMMLSLTQTEKAVNVSHAEILALNGTTLFEIPLKEVDNANKRYLAEAFIPPNELFYIAVNGVDEDNQEFRRVGATAVQAKPPDVPYLTVSDKIQAYRHESVTLQCDVESLVPVNVMWTKDGSKIQPQISSWQSTSVQHVISNMTEDNVGTYVCVARNAAGISQAVVEVEIFVEPPILTLTANTSTVMVGEGIFIHCSVPVGTILTKYQLLYNGYENKTKIINYSDNPLVYQLTNIIDNVTENNGGVYTCIAANEGGLTSKSITITITRKPTAQILGPHTLSKLLQSTIQLVCVVEHCSEIQWLYNSVVVERRVVNDSDNAMLEREVDGDGVWTCEALKGGYKASDSVQVLALIQPEVQIQGDKNITILNGTVYSITCVVKAKPEPRIIWHRETDTFLNHTVSLLSPNVYKSVLELDSNTDRQDATYFCFGENAAGIHQDSASVRVRTAMKLAQGFKDTSVQLYSNVTMTCNIDSHPKAHIIWYHNNTELVRNSNVYKFAGNSIIFIERVEFDNLGLYTCKANNGYEEVTVNGTLSVIGLEFPLLSKEPEIKLIQKGQSTILTCSILKGNPKPVLSWQFQPESSEMFKDLISEVAMNNNGSEVMISSAKVEHTGVYRCMAENVLGEDYYDVKLVVQYPPEILSNGVLEDHKPLEVEAGQRIALSCQAEGVPKPLVTWTKDLMPLGYTKNRYLTKENDLVIEKTTEYDSGLYSCNASSVLSSTQKNFTVIIYVPPNIVTESEITPEPQEFVEGQLVELPCRATGSPRPEVTWLQNGNPVTEERKYIDDFGMRFVANLTDFGEYTCIVKNRFGNASFTYTVFVWVPPSIQPPLQTDNFVFVGINKSLNCDAMGFPIPSIYWEFDGVLIKENNTNLNFNGYGTINITNASSKEEGVYTCVAENIVGVSRKHFALHVHEPPKILNDNYTTYIATEKDVLLKVFCKAVGRPRPYVFWMKDNVYLDKDIRYNVDSDGTLTINTPSEELSGTYTCMAKNSIGMVNKTVAVEIYPLPEKMQADESTLALTFVEGANASVECPVKTSRNSSVTWYKDAKLISQGRLSLPNISRHNDSTYACVVSNAVGSTHTNVRVRVEWPPRFVEEEAREIQVVKGGDRWLECGVDTNPSAKIKWMFNSRMMLGEDKSRLKLINLQLHHTGVYKCIASNKHGNGVRQFSLEVLVPPYISDFDLMDVQLKEGMGATLECNAKGSPQPEIHWTYSNPTWQLVNSSLSTTNATFLSEGLFTCSALNIAGSARLSYRVTIVAPSRVEEVEVYAGERGTTVEAGAEIVLGSKSRISCKASGTPSPKIQWIKNGKTLSENLQDINYADLMFDNVNASSSGVYTCVASNDGGGDDRRIKVDVLEPPKIFQALFQNWNSTVNETKLEVISGQAFYLHCHPAGNPMPEVYWFKDGLPLRLFDDTMVSTNYGEVIETRSARPEQSGNYTCVARNNVGNTSVVYIVDVLVPPPTPKEASHTIATRIGKQLTLTCPVEGSPTPFVTWLKQPYTEVVNTSRLILSDDNVTLTIHKSDPSDSGLYSCIMTNKVGTTEAMFDVTIEKSPSIAGNVGANITETRVVALRRSLVLKCEVDGHPVPKITWLKDTLQLSNTSGDIHRALGNSVVAVWSVTSRHAGQYICVAENGAGTSHRRHDVLVRVPGKWSPWSQWSYCNATCGLGHQTRSRLCQYTDDYVTVDDKTKSDKIVLDQSTCRGPRTEQRKCHMPPCEDGLSGSWSAWGRWSPCSATCGAGTMARTRRCRGQSCVGDNVQIRKCPDLPKCNSTENEVYSGEDEIENNPYTPEATFEFQPEVVGVEEFYNRPAPSLPVVYEATVLPNPRQGPCKPGYVHNDTTHTCDDVDECLIETNQCHLTQICVNTVGGYQCSCQPGYTSLGAGRRCLDINECEQDIDGCEHACVNVAGGYVCACPRHWRLRDDKRHCYRASSYRQYQDSEAEYLSFAVDAPAKYRNTRN